MRIEIQDGQLVLSGGPRRGLLTLSYWFESTWRTLKISRSDAGYAGEDQRVSAKLVLTEQQGHLAYELSFKATCPTRLQLKLGVAQAQNVFHLIPCNIHGDNNLAKAEPGHYPNLTTQHAESQSCSAYWEFRADRAAMPVSILCFDGGVAGVSIDPYSECSIDLTTSREGFIRNGVFSQLASVGEPNACGVTLGYRNTPHTFIASQWWGLPTEHAGLLGTAKGCIFLENADSRLGVHRIIRCLYDDYRQTPETPITMSEAVESLTDAFLEINWQPDKENFANLRLNWETHELQAWRTLAEIGWSGGGTIGYPLLVAGHLLGNAKAIERGRYKLDWLGRAYNPASGLLWDVCGKQEGAKDDGWWSGFLVKGVHCAYTNGHGLYYLLKAYKFCRDVLGEEHPEWLATGCKAADTIVTLQEPSGNFGYTYSIERPEIIDAEGFVGVWFVPALVYAYQLTGEKKYLDAARRGIEFYHGFVKDLECWGGPMDTFKSPDQEGNTGFIRGAALLHQELKEQKYLQMLIDGADYEYLWRYGFRARPEYPPLKNSHWNSCGGSVTSVSNPHIHPWGLFISSELQYLADQTGDTYHAQRTEDGLNFGINIVSLYPDVMGYGRRGVLTERYCPSDGLTTRLYPDKTPSSTWFSYNGWAAAAVLEGLAERMQQ